MVLRSALGYLQTTSRLRENGVGSLANCLSLKFGREQEQNLHKAEQRDLGSWSACPRLTQEAEAAPQGEGQPPPSEPLLLPIE